MLRKLFPYLKAIIAALVPAYLLYKSAVTDGTITGDEWRTIGETAVGALLVLLVPAPGYRAPGETRPLLTTVEEGPHGRSLP